ncbi:hypothetical protein BS47DRAFT_654968 [Hydnum rufescens UP504]|uniref:Bromo domain-containing protein n=1 Tax=Hydnum rufescens UP504 TaxID=1448309 RepID=A0A9P6B2K1_9AGAM|nr:hypothetical protein BS47DRAFT_654968 [Hydnum rufescens UP504]
MDQLGAGMSKRKRQAGDPAAAVEAGPRVKRRKETSGMSFTIPAQKSRTSGTPAQEAISEEHEHEDGDNGTEEDVQGGGEGAEQVRELGLQMWQAVRGARSNDGRDITIDFLKLPPKKQYPDYYTIIKKPIALDEIKTKIENGSYSTLKAIKRAFDQCFRNAKRYNMNESPIWVAAKIMQKIASKEYKKLAASPDTEEDDVDVGDADVDVPPNTSAAAIVESDDDDDPDDGDDGDEAATPNGTVSARKSSRKQSLSRLLKNKLQKLIKKAPKDAEGNLFSNPFLVLPNKKEWPDYYRLIEKPIAFDAIFKKLKKKMYPTTADFVSDVELLFSNALLFNEDQSPVWIAAQTLRPMFYKLLVDLPPEYAPSAIPTQPPGQGQSQGGPKIKLRMQPKSDAPAAPSAATTTTTIPTAASSQVTPSHTGDQTLQQTFTNTASTSTPGASTSRQRQTISKTAGSAPPPTAAVSPLPVPSKSSQPQSQTPQYQYPPTTSATHRPPASGIYHPQPQFPPPTTTLASSHPTAMTAARSYNQYPPTPPVAPRSPTPEITPTTIIRSITLVTAPAGRTIVFHSTGDGGGLSIRYWAVRLGRNETTVKLRIDVEKGPDEEEGEEGESTAGGTESAVLVDTEGKRFSAAVKLNGGNLAPAPQRTLRSTSTPAPEVVMADGTKDDAPKTNGHHDGGAFSGSDSEDESGKGKGPAARSTRSGKVPTLSTKNGKTKRKRRGKKVGGTTVGIDLGPWDVSLVVGSNVLDVRAGGKNGERWRVFVDRVL